jgi:hypothetical protein
MGLDRALNRRAMRTLGVLPGLLGRLVVLVG